MAKLNTVLEPVQSSDNVDDRYIAPQIILFLKNTEEFKPVSASQIPDDSPIGSF